MKRSLPLLALGLCLLSCASSPKPENSWWKGLSDTEANPEDEALSCRGVRSGIELDQLASCWPPNAPALGFTDVRGLDEMSPVLRDCLLAGLPAITLEGEDRARCQQGLATVLSRRLYQLGWLKAGVKPLEDTGAAARTKLGVQLGQRYRVGELFVTTGPSQHVNSKKIIKKAQKAIPKRRWCTQTALEDIQTRVFDPSSFEHVAVSIGALDDAAARASILITIQE